MARIKSDRRQNFSLPLWIIGFFSQNKFFLYCVDVGGEEREVREVRMSEKRKRRRIHDDYQEVLSRGRGPGTRDNHEVLSRGRGSVSEGLVIQPSSVRVKMFDSSSVALYNFIYTAGGCHPHRHGDKLRLSSPGKYIYCLDTNHVDQGWKRIIEMKTGRRSPKLAVLDGKFYVFGGAARLDESMQCLHPSSPLAEVFDPLAGKIDVVPDGYTDDLQLVGVDHDLKRIVFLSRSWRTEQFRNSKTETSHLVFYNAEKQEWTKESHKRHVFSLFGMLRCSRVVVGTTIYWVSKYLYLQINAYDFVKHRFYFSKEIKNLAQVGPPSLLDDNTQRLFFLRYLSKDCFCLFWRDDGLDESNYSQIHCMKLQISTWIADNYLPVSALGTRTYLMGGGGGVYGFSLTDILPVL